MHRARRVCTPLMALGAIASLAIAAQSPVLIDAQETKLRAGDPGGDWFGYSVDVEGDVAVVGSFYDSNGNGTYAGSVYVFERIGLVWSQTAKLLASNGASYDYFGVAVAVDGDTIVVGAHGDDTAAGVNAGSAYVFARCSGAWTQQAQLLHPSGATSDVFGSSVGIDGDTVVVGAYLDDACFTDSGSA